MHFAFTAAGKVQHTVYVPAQKQTARRPELLPPYKNQLPVAVRMPTDEQTPTRFFSLYLLHFVSSSSCLLPVWFFTFASHDLWPLLLSLCLTVTSFRSVLIISNQLPSQHSSGKLATFFSLLTFSFVCTELSCHAQSVHGEHDYVLPSQLHQSGKKCLRVFCVNKLCAIKGGTILFLWAHETSENLSVNEVYILKQGPCYPG